MHRRFHDRFGTAGVVIAVIALIAALGGTALAASGLNSKQKKEVKSIAKSFQGTGPAGAQGPAGANGKDGANGSNGSNGTAGAAGATGKTGPTGATGVTGATGTTGDPWTAGGTLPSGKTETGAYRDEGTIATAISFNIPLAAELDGSHVKVNNLATAKGDLTSGSATVTNLQSVVTAFQVGAPISGTGIPTGTTITAASGTELTLSQAATATNTEVALTQGPFPECDNGAAPEASAKNPEADPGYLCAFNASFEAPVAIIKPTTRSPSVGAATTGAEPIGFASGGWGTWAVTAP